MEEEEANTILSSHDGGRLLGEQSPTIPHSRELQVAKIHGGEWGYKNMLGLEGRPLWPRIYYPCSNPIGKYILEELV
jgi:hypothetical protein